MQTPKIGQILGFRNFSSSTLVQSKAPSQKFLQPVEFSPILKAWSDDLMVRVFSFNK